MKKKIRVVMDIFLFLMPFAAWLQMFGGVSGVLSSRGFVSLKYFTVLSNFLEGIASGIWLLNMLSQRNMERMHRAEVLKYVACMSVLLTFTTVMVFLGPIFGYPSMFEGANLWFHLVIPLVALAEMLLLVKENFTSKENLWAIIPVLCYGSVYLGSIIVNGRGDAEAGWNDFYGFAAWGIPAGVLIFAGICLFVYAAGFLIRKRVRGRIS